MMLKHLAAGCVDFYVKRVESLSYICHIPYVAKLRYVLKYCDGFYAPVFRKVFLLEFTSFCHGIIECHLYFSYLHLMNLRIFFFKHLLFGPYIDAASCHDKCSYPVFFLAVESHLPVVWVHFLRNLECVRKVSVFVLLTPGSEFAAFLKLF